MYICIHIHTHTHAHTHTLTTAARSRASRGGGNNKKVGGGLASWTRRGEGTAALCWPTLGRCIRSSPRCLEPGAQPVGHLCVCAHAWHVCGCDHTCVGGSGSAACKASVCVYARTRHVWMHMIIRVRAGARRWRRTATRPCGCSDSRRRGGKGRACWKSTLRGGARVLGISSCSRTCCRWSGTCR